MSARVNLNGWTKERKIAYPHLANVEYDAVEVEVDPSAEIDVAAIITIERRLHPDRITAAAKQLNQ